jgi:MFS family permease
MSLKSLPKGVIALGFVSMFMDISSEMIHSLLPVFMVTVLGASPLVVGVIEGIAEATVSVVKIFSGAVSDWIGRRKPLVLLGYGLAALTKPLFPVAESVYAVLIARFADRIGKGIRGAPRDALIADITGNGNHGAAYGLRQSMDTIGAFTGPILALLLMLAFGGDFRLVFWLAVIPAGICVLLIIFGVEEPELKREKIKREFPIKKSQLEKLGAAFWLIVAFSGILTLARFSEAFLLLKANDVGMAASYTPLILIAMNVVYAFSAYPAGKLSDQNGRYGLLAPGILVLVLADIVLAHADTALLVAAGAGLWGLHMGLTQGILTAMVADVAPPGLRGTAFGIFNLVMGLFLLIASALAGWLWKDFGPGATFWAGAVFSLLSLVFIYFRRLAR